MTGSVCKHSQSPYTHKRIYVYTHTRRFYRTLLLLCLGPSHTIIAHNILVSLSGTRTRIPYIIQYNIINKYIPTTAVCIFPLYTPGTHHLDCARGNVAGHQNNITPYINTILNSLNIYYIIYIIIVIVVVVIVAVVVILHVRFGKTDADRPEYDTV